MRALPVFLLLLCFSFSLAAQPGIILPESTVTFSVNNMKVNTVRGSMNQVEGLAFFNPASPEQSNFDVLVAVKSLSTGIAKRDKELMEDGFFDDQKYPTLHVRSTAIEHAAAEGVYHFTGLLNIKNVEKELACKFTAHQEGGKWFLTGSFEINRKEFGLGEDYSNFTIGETVAIEVKLVCTAK